MARTHINSCDFSLSNYAHVEDEKDSELHTFSLERNKESLIPMIKDALRKRENKIKIMASPWSPPAWMKTTGQMNFGGKLKNEHIKTWADYYCKFIKHCKKKFQYGEFQFKMNQKPNRLGILVYTQPKKKETL